MAKPPSTNPFAVIFDIEKRLRNSLTVDEVGFIIVNETYKIVQYRQAILFDNTGKIKSISGTSNFEENSPFIYWVKQNLSPIAKNIVKPKELRSQDLGNIPDLNWEEWLPQFGFFLPLFSPIHGKVGSLFLSWEKNWNSSEREILGVVANIYGFSIGTFKKNRRLPSINNVGPLVKISILITLVMIFFIPVPLTVLAPSEIVAVNPSIVRAPITGVVEKVVVEPNQVVSKGDLLFIMESLSQKNDLIIAQKVFASLKVQYAQLTRQALSDLTSKRFLVETLGRLKEQEIRIDNLNKSIERTRILAPRNGTVIIDSPRSWEGRPVNLGERIVSLADQNLVEIESWLSVADVIDLKKGASLRVYLNSDPLSPISASLRTFSYEAQERPSGTLAYRIRAKILNTTFTPRLGLRGTARISGAEVPIIYWILRRPISTLRQFFGL